MLRAKQDSRAGSRRRVTGACDARVAFKLKWRAFRSCVDRAVTRAGQQIPCDVVVLGIGVEPVVDLLVRGRRGR